MHDLDQWTSIRIRAADDERVVARVDIGREECRSLRIGSRDDKALNTHNVELKSNRDKPVNVLLYGNKYFACHVTALFRAWRLVLNVNTCSATFHEKLRKFHCCRYTAVASVGIRYDRAEIVDNWDRSKLRIAHTGAFFALLAVVEELSSEKVFNLIRYGVIGVILKNADLSKVRERQ